MATIVHEVSAEILKAFRRASKSRVGDAMIMAATMRQVDVRKKLRGPKGRTSTRGAATRTPPRIHNDAFRMRWLPEDHRSHVADAT